MERAYSCCFSDGPHITPNPAQIPCGSELARESGGADTDMLTEAPPSRASSLPQGFVRGKKQVVQLAFRFMPIIVM
jgi:hypothetical protein